MNGESLAAAPPQWGVFGVLVFFVVGVCLAVYRGYLVPRRTVDALLAGRDAQITALQTEADEWRTAWHADHDLVVRMSGQMEELVTASQGAAQALQSLTYEAARNRR